MKLPLRELGLDYIPAVPVDLEGMADTLARLTLRARQREQALMGLTKTFTIGGTTARAYDFLFGGAATDAKPVPPSARDHLHSFLKANPADILPSLISGKIREHDAALDHEATSADPRTTLPLDDPRQWAISWTTMPDVASDGQPHLDEWAATLDVTQPDKATAAFFPTIARYGLAYNLILPKKVTVDDVGTWRDLFGSAWVPALDSAAKAGLLYVIDLRIFESLQPQTVDGAPRFTPGTVTILWQDPKTKALTPELVRVSGGGNDPRIFSRKGSTTPSAWLYALQAAKVSVTVYGIWFGHVYHWHIVTAAMQMTMFATLPARHPVRTLLEPQSSYLIPFDDVLLVLWSSAAPPTSIASGWQFLELMDLFAKDRQFFDDDPTNTLEQLGITQADFTVAEPWDQYPIAGQLLEVWKATGDYVSTCVDQAYATDRAVQQDKALQAWIAASAQPGDGNVQGLPTMDGKDDLKRVLHSLVYRLTAHGTGRLYRTANPALTFVANFPPCLQGATIPDPTASFDTKALLRYLPNTGTIGSMVHFYFTFSFSTPYVPFVPLAGPDTDLWFDDAVSNKALVELRKSIAGFIESFEPGTPQIWQWPRNIET